MTDPVVTVVYFSVVFLVFCLAAAAAMHYLDWRYGVNDRREQRRQHVMRERQRRLFADYTMRTDWESFDDIREAWERKAAA